MFVAHVENAMKSRESTLGSTGEAKQYNYLFILMRRFSGGCGVRVDDRRDARDWRQSFCGRAKREDGETDYYYYVSSCLILSHLVSSCLILSHLVSSCLILSHACGESICRSGSAGASASLNEEAQRLSRSFALRESRTAIYVVPPRGMSVRSSRTRESRLGTIGEEASIENSTVTCK